MEAGKANKPHIRFQFPCPGSWQASLINLHTQGAQSSIRCFQVLSGKAPVTLGLLCHLPLTDRLDTGHEIHLLGAKRDLKSRFTLVPPLVPPRPRPSESASPAALELARVSISGALPVSVTPLRCP